jgi:hypothetical protein
MSIEERAVTIRAQMRADIANTLRQHLGRGTVITGPMLDALVDDGMFHVEHLLVECACTEQREMIDHV